AAVPLEPVVSVIAQDEVVCAAADQRVVVTAPGQSSRQGSLVLESVGSTMPCDRNAAHGAAGVHGIKNGCVVRRAVQVDRFAVRTGNGDLIGPAGAADIEHAGRVNPDQVGHGE